MNELLNAQLLQGRTNIFDKVFIHLGIWSKNLVRKCVSIYRQHDPNIELFSAAQECLNKFSDIPLYIVTDGNTTAQRNKLIALNLYYSSRIKHCYLTWRYGLKHSKPSPYCFFLISKRERVLPQNIIYIGDNPYKDFVGIKPYGFRTIRVHTGQYKCIDIDTHHDADTNINSLSELSVPFLKKFIKNQKI